MTVMLKEGKMAPKQFYTRENGSHDRKKIRRGKITLLLWIQKKKHGYMSKYTALSLDREEKFEA